MTFRKYAAVALLAAAPPVGFVAAPAAAADIPQTSWPITDAAGVQYSTLTFNPESRYAIACYASPESNIRIEAMFSQLEQPLVRQVPQFGCTVIGPYSGTGDITAVRGVVGDYANEWHKV